MRRLFRPLSVLHGAIAGILPPAALATGCASLEQRQREPKKLLLIENGSHNCSMWMVDAAYQPALGDLFGLHGTPEGDARVNGRPFIGVLSLGSAHWGQSCNALPIGGSALQL